MWHRLQSVLNTDSSELPQTEVCATSDTEPGAKRLHAREWSLDFYECSSRWRAVASLLVLNYSCYENKELLICCADELVLVGNLLTHARVLEILI